MSEPSRPSRPTRRRFLASASAAVGVGAVGLGAVGLGVGEPASLGVAQDGGETTGHTVAGSDRFVAQSQKLPRPRVVFPTDALPAPSGPKKRIAAITTAYWKYSHADDIITKFIEGYSIVGRTHRPHCQVVGLYVQQFPKTDISRAMAARYHIPMFDTPGEALTLGGDKLAVDGVLLIGEHGDFPFNKKGQQLYPRRELFEQIVDVFRRSGRAVPVYNDKHFSYAWENAKWMYDQSRKLGFPMMAGSSVPVAWRRPPLAFRPGIELDAALSVGFGGKESYGFHALETMQTFVERRRGGETGVKSVQALAGDDAWRAAAQGRWRVELLEAAIDTLPKKPKVARGLENLRRADPGAALYLVKYSDGFEAATYMSARLVDEFCFAASVKGRPEPVATWCQLNKPQRDHFSFLCNHIEVMFRSGRPSYPVERTYLVTGVLEAAIDSLAASGKAIETPHLAKIGYRPAKELTVK